MCELGKAGASLICAELGTQVRRVVDFSSNSEVTVFWRRKGYQSLAPQRVGVRVQMYLGCKDAVSGK